MTLAVKVPCLRSLWKLYFCLHEWCFRLADPSIRQMKKRKKASSKEEPHSLILGEGGACHVEMGVSNPPVPPPFIFLISACSAYSVCLQELNKATNKIQFINKSHIQKSSLSVCYVPRTRNRKWTRSAFTELQDRTSLGTWSVVTPWDCVRPSPSKRIPPSWSRERDLEGLMAASKINKWGGGFTQRKLANVVLLSFWKQRMHNLRFRLEVVKNAFPRIPGANLSPCLFLNDNHELQWFLNNCWLCIKAVPPLYNSGKQWMPFKVPKKKSIAPLPSCCIFSYGQIHPEPDSWATSLYILSVFQGKTPSTAKPSIFIYSSVLALSSAPGSLRLPCASPSSLVGFLVKPICPFSQNSKKRTRSDLKS